jgi:hypothetical protein
VRRRRVDDYDIFHVYSKIADYGWVYWVGSLVLIIVAHDTYFYWTHRWMHGPNALRRLHRTHHVSVAPTQWAAHSFSIGEAAVQAGFLPLYLLLVPTHDVVLFIWMAHPVIRNAAGPLRRRVRAEVVARDVVGLVVHNHASSRHASRTWALQLRPVLRMVGSLVRHRASRVSEASCGAREYDGPRGLIVA